MIEYFNESINKKINLKITTSKNKKIIAKAIMYSNDKLYYKSEKFDNISNIFISNIKNIEFEKYEDEISFRKKLLKLPLDVEKYLDYYNECINKLESKSNYKFKTKMFENMFNSIYTQSSDNLFIRFLKNQKEKNKISDNSQIFLLSNSNLSQRTAIKNALNNDISIIQGPPGTGKTTTILSLIANFIMKDKNVVVVSKNNSAVDNIIEEFQKTSLPEFFLRFGRKDDYMEPLQNEISTKLSILEKNLNEISYFNEDLTKLNSLQSKLENLETEVDELISIKNLLVDLKIQKKFMDKEQELYNFKELLTESEMKIITDKNACKNRLIKIFEYSKKHNFNFFQRLIVKYYYCIKDGDINQKFYALFQLLKDMYIKKEIANKEYILLKRDLENKQKEIKLIYEEYIESCIKAFKYCLKKKMTSGLKNMQNDNLLDLAFNVYPLILTTADAFLSNFENTIKNSKKVDVIIIDEASQCDILTGLPLLYAADKLVVVGDEKQLSAITNLEINTNIPNEYRYDGNTFLNCIKNVFAPPEKTLEEHYRCDYNIINFCNKFYYDNKLKIYTKANASSIEIVNTSKYKGAVTKGGSFLNKRECYTIEDLINNDDDYFVITPFKAQGVELQNIFEKKRAGTIHTFQGKGADKVYFSSVLNNLTSCNDHIKSDHNMFTPELVNVAVSRAKKKFVLASDEDYFKKNSNLVPEINHLIDYIKIYGEKIDDKTSCWYDYLYKNIPLYKKTELYDNEYEEVTHQHINSLLKNTPYICIAKKFLTELILNKNFLNNNPKIREYIRNGAHADFTIYDTRTNKLKVVIELDGKYHYSKQQQIKDNYKNAAFKAISIPVIRIKSKEPINDSLFLNKLKKYIDIK